MRKVTWDIKSRGLDMMEEGAENFNDTNENKDIGYHDCKPPRIKFELHPHFHSPIKFSIEVKFILKLPISYSRDIAH